MKAISERLEESSQLLQTTMKTINLKVQSDTIDDILTNVRDVSARLQESDIKSLIQNIANVAKETDQLLLKMDKEFVQGSEDFSRSLYLLQSTLENLNKASMKINNDPSLLLRRTKNQGAPDHNLKN